MKDWFYFTFGFALLFLFLRGEKAGRTKGREIWPFYLELSLAFFLLFTLDSLLSKFLWNPAGRGDLRTISLFFWAFLADEERKGLLKKRKEEGEFPESRFFLGLSGATFLISKGSLLWVLSFIFGTGIFEWLLEGLRDRLRLSNVPRIFEGAPLLLWTAMLLFLGLWGCLGAGIHL